MSMVKCFDCDCLVDSDDDPECFVEVIMKRDAGIITLCKACREIRGGDDIAPYWTQDVHP